MPPESLEILPYQMVGQVEVTGQQALDDARRFACRMFLTAILPF